MACDLCIKSLQCRTPQGEWQLTLVFNKFRMIWCGVGFSSIEVPSSKNLVYYGSAWKKEKRKNSSYLSFSSFPSSPPPPRVCVCMCVNMSLLSSFLPFAHCTLIIIVGMLLISFWVVVCRNVFRVTLNYIRIIASVSIFLSENPGIQKILIYFKKKQVSGLYLWQTYLKD